MKLACDSVRENLSLLLYGELSFTEEEAVQAHLQGCTECRAALDTERAWHDGLALATVEPPADLLVKCRQQLRANLPEPVPQNWLQRLWRGLDLNLNLRSLAKPAMALGLVAVGYLGARLPNLTEAPQETAAAHVRYVEADAAGNVRIVLDETKPRIVSGRTDDPQVRRWLLAAAREANDPGLRAETVALLQGGVEAVDVRRALVSALESDPNPGVRLKAIEGLRRHAGERDTRQALMRVLTADENPGIRTQAIDLLTESGPRSLDAQMVGALQQLMRREENGYVRQRCEKALRLANASAEIF
ncbi:MAG: HEAT repeat domain-containing protein [Bryobacteraceae bacterium]|nr:HEAT repeat domain-containing protein [Bryobacteraceae bacterium]